MPGSQEPIALATPAPERSAPPKVLTDNQAPVEPLAVLDLMREGR